MRLKESDEPLFKNKNYTNYVGRTKIENYANSIEQRV